MLPFGVHQLSISHRRATDGKARNRGADTLGAVQGALDVSRLDWAAWAVCQVRPGERLEFQAAGMVGGEKPSRGFFLTRMKHPPLDSPSSLSPPRALLRMSSRAVCTRLSRHAQLSVVLLVLSRSLRICPSDRLAVCVVGLGLALVLVRWWWWSLV